MRRIAVILIGIGLVISGTILLIKDAFGESIEHVAQQVAVNAVAMAESLVRQDLRTSRSSYPYEKLKLSLQD